MMELGEHSDLPNAWLAMTVGDDRQRGNNDGYDDEPSSHYEWDSTVPNYGAVAAGDFLVLWDRNQLLGASVINRIQLGAQEKRLYRCPSCNRADIKARKRLHPEWRCNKCHEEFLSPTVRTERVTTYRTDHESSWVDLNGLLRGRELRKLCHSPSSQLSLRSLRWNDFAEAVELVGGPNALQLVKKTSAHIKGGFRLVTARARVGQGKFRTDLLHEMNAVCAFTGATPAAALEAAHLYSFAATGEHHSGGGLLLRRDLHRLFDHGDLAVNPKTMTIDVATSLLGYREYAALHGRPLQVPTDDRHHRWIELHWAGHRRR